MSSHRRVIGPSRRDLLRQTASATGAAFLGGALSAQGTTRALPKALPNRVPGAGEPVRIGVVGTGQMGLGHVAALLGLKYSGAENIEIVGLCDVCQPRLELALELLRERQPGVEVRGHVSHAELLARDDIHGVILTVPEHWHAQMAVDAIAAGKDAYLEKPMTLRLEDAFWLRDVVQANPQMRLQIGTQYMMQEKYRVARGLIADGAIGHPTSSQTSYCRNSRRGEWMYSIDSKVKPDETLDWAAWCGPLGERDWDPAVYHRWRRYRDFSTGIVGDLLVHQLAPMIYALDAGWPVRVTAAGGHYVDKLMENHDQVTLTVEFEKDHTLVVAGSTSNELGLETLIRGHAGNIFLGGTHCVVRPERIFADDVEERTIECGSDEPQNALRSDWLRAIRTRDPVASSVELGLQHMVVVELATRSLWERKAFEFDPATGAVAPA